MSSRAQVINDSDEEFEVIDGPAASAPGPIGSTKPIAEVERNSERAFEPLIAVMQSTADALSTTGPIFHAKLSSSDPELLYSTFVSGFPEDYRRIFNCSACQRFSRQFANLCVVGEDGSLQALFWPQEAVGVPAFYVPSVTKVLKLFEGQAVGDEFQIRSENGRELGTRIAGGWSHMSANLAKVPLARSGGSMDSQNTTTSYTMLDRIMTDYSAEVVLRAHHIVHDNQLPYVESHKAPISYLNDVITSLAAKDQKNPVLRKNLITNYARKAFPGCLSSLRAGMVGCLLDSIKEGEDFETLKRKWMEKANPLAYLRPTATPSAGNIMNAEKIFEKLGYTQHDLARVFLTHDQIPESAILWSPSTEDAKKASMPSSMPLFGHLLDKTNSLKISDDSNDPTTDLSFRHFALRVLPNALSIELLVKDKITASFFTNGRAGSKPLMAFHSETNTASWYVWGSDEAPTRASLKAGWTPVLSVITFPHMWENISPRDALENDKIEEFKHKRHDIRYLFCLKGVREVKHVGLGLFPTLMRGEFHEVRKTVESFSLSGTMDQPPVGKEHVGGLVVGKSSIGREENTLLVKVKSRNGQVSKYRICLFD